MKNTLSLTILILILGVVNGQGGNHTMNILDNRKYTDSTYKTNGFISIPSDEYYKMKDSIKHMNKTIDTLMMAVDLYANEASRERYKNDSLQLFINKTLKYFKIDLTGKQLTDRPKKLKYKKINGKWKRISANLKAQYFFQQIMKVDKNKPFDLVNYHYYPF